MPKSLIPTRPYRTTDLAPAPQAPFLTLKRVTSILAGGDTTSEQLVRELVVALADESASGFLRLDMDLALQQARASDERRKTGQLLGPLDGVPLAHKDMFHRAGRVSRYGSKLFDDAPAAEADSPLLKALDRSGAVDLGVLHMAELALSVFGLNVHTGNSRNPWSRHHPAGGSSSGSAVAVARGYISASIGSDTGGSLRLPATACAVSSFKPTNGRLSMENAFQLAPSLDCPGIIAPTAQDCLTVLRSIDQDSTTPTTIGSFTLAVPDLSKSAKLHPDIAANLARVIGDLCEAGYDLQVVPLPNFDEANVLATRVTAYEANRIHGYRLRENPELVGQQVRRRILEGAEIEGADYEAAMRERRSRTGDFLDRCLGSADALILPTFGFPLPRFDQLPEPTDAADRDHLNMFSHWTRPLNYFGLPVAQLPTGLAGAMPTGIQLLGRPDSDHQLLNIAAGLQTRMSCWQKSSIPPRRLSGSYIESTQP